MSISGSPANYRAATWLGHHRDKKADASLKKLATDVIPILRIAALLALCKLWRADEYLQRLIPEISDPNLIIGLYAMNSIEQTGLLNETVKKATEIAHNSRYEFTLRCSKRLKSKCE